jgi:hypothetical protein
LSPDEFAPADFKNKSFNSKKGIRSPAQVKKEHLVERSDSLVESGEMLDSDLPSLDASGIAEYIRFDCCPRYFKLRFEGDEESCRKWPEAFKPLSPLLYGAGKELEAKKVAELQARVARYHDLSHLDTRVVGWDEAWTESIKIIKEILNGSDSPETESVASGPVLVYQVPMRGFVGVWAVKGIADLIAIWPTKQVKN